MRFVKFSPDGSLVVTASDDRSARVWRVATINAKTSHFRGHYDDQNYDQNYLNDDGERYYHCGLDSNAGPVPDWFPDFLRYTAQMRLNSDGELETIKTADWLALRERLREVLRLSADQEAPYLRILRCFVHA